MSGIEDLQLSERQINKPLVSIITPVLNGERYIADTVKSVLSQTYPNIEHIIIDGNSRDKTVSIIKALNPEAILFSEPDRGATDAINKGLQIAKGEIIGLLNYDDYYANSNVIQKVVSMFILSPDIKVLYGKVKCIHPQTEDVLGVYGKQFDFEKMLGGDTQMMPYPATFAKREVYDATGFFSLDYLIYTDYEYYLRVVKLYKPSFVDDIFTIMRWGGSSTNTKNIFKGHLEAYKIMRDNGISNTVALSKLLYKLVMSFFSLTLQRIGLKGIVLFYRQIKGQLR